MAGLPTPTDAVYDTVISVKTTGFPFVLAPSKAATRALSISATVFLAWTGLILDARLKMLLLEHVEQARKKQWKREQKVKTGE